MGTGKPAVQHSAEAMRNRHSGTISQQTAEWATRLDLSAIPESVLHRVKLHILDQLGAQCVAANRAPILAVRTYALPRLGSGPCSVLGEAEGADAETAAFVNATAGHGMEIDDYAQGAFAHPGCVVVPGVLALAEEVDADGAAALAAITAGFEHIVRLALASMPSMMVDRGFHQTGAHGVFGVALGASMLLGSDPDTTAHALGVAGSQASGTTEYSRSGGEVKRVHAGFGAADGIRAARLAAAGITAPMSIFEGVRGFLQAFAATYDVAPLTDDLGHRWCFDERAALKPWACCAFIHAGYAALDKLRESRQFELEDIASVEMGVDRFSMGHVGSIGPRPRQMIEAQFSAHFGMAMRIVGGGNDVVDYARAEGASFSDPAVLQMADKVTLTVDPDVEAEWPGRWLTRATVRLRTGDCLTSVAEAPGTPANPMSEQMVEEKFRRTTSEVLDPSAQSQLVELIMNLQQVRDVRSIGRILRTAGRVGPP